MAPQQAGFIREAGLVLVGAVILSGLHVAVEKATGSAQWYLVIATILLIVGLFATIYGINKAINDVNDLKRETLTTLEAVAPSFTYYSVASDKRERERLFRVVSDIIANARTQILAINAWREEWRWPQANPEYRHDYFDTLIEASRRVGYHRIVQVDPKDKTLAGLFDQCYLNHFKAMLTAAKHPGRRSDAGPVLLQRIRPTFPTTFVIVDGVYLLWQLNEVVLGQEDAHGRRQKRFRMRAVIVVHDPRRSFINHFVETFWAAASREPTAVAVDQLKSSKSSGRVPTSDVSRNGDADSTTSASTEDGPGSPPVVAPDDAYPTSEGSKNTAPGA